MSEHDDHPKDDTTAEHDAAGGSGDDRKPALDRARAAAADVVERGQEAARARLSDARTRLQDATGEVGERIKTVAETARERGEEWREKAKERATRTTHATRERYDETVVQLRDSYDHVRDNVEGAADDLSDYVRVHPGKTILIAALAGFVLGLAFRRLDDDDSEYDET